MADAGKQSSRSTLADGHVVAGRYRVQRMLGRGGSATVYSALDEHSGAHVALKQLLVDSDAGQRALLQREFHTLAQITHPGVIRVREYGVALDGPFYTMELLDGHDLSELAPMPWRKACKVLCEVASALAILHSRRLVHRDVSHRNVRLTAEGHAKLIDFGAMSPMGLVPDLIGTPPFLSPEAADGGLLDQRTDLYALGALAYFLLVGAHLYPAKTVRALRELWRHGSTAPAFPDEVPTALQQLVMALVQRDPTARPSTAAEVIDRLSALADLPARDELHVAHAYLANPKLIGRQGELALLKAELDRALAAGRATTLVLTGSYGTGKSRLLQELALQAKFAGFTVLQTAGASGESQPFGVMTRLFGERASAAQRVGGSSASAQEQRARVQAELTALVLERSAAEPLLLAIDDLDACDAESLGVLVALSRSESHAPSLLVASRELGAGSGQGVRLIAARATRSVALRAFDAVDTERLVESLFGSSPASQRVAGWMHQHARGNPLECMELARHLVDSGEARYVEGAWMLPHDRPAGLPRGLAEAFEQRIAGLPAAQRSLAELLALHGKAAPLSWCIELEGATDASAAFSALSELVSSDLVSARGDQYAISREGLRVALLEGLSSARRRELHERIGQSLAARGIDSAAAKLEAGVHLMRGASRARGLGFVEQAVENEELVSHLGEPVVPALVYALEVAELEHVAPVRTMRLRARLASCAYLYDRRLADFAEPLIDRLRFDSGLALLEEIDVADPTQRLSQAIALAQQRHDATAPEARGMPPLEALLDLARLVGNLLGVAIYGYDVATINRFARLVAPLATLDKHVSLAVIYDLVTVVHELTSGRLQHAYLLRDDLIARLRDPASYLGLGEVHRSTILATQLHAKGLREAALSARRAFAIADEIDALGMQMYVGAAHQVRLLAQLYCGDVDAARQSQLQLDAVSLQGGAGRQTEIWLLSYLVGPYSLWGDVLALKRAAERLTAMLADHPSYRAAVYVALGAYYRERGQLAESTSALAHAREHALGGFYAQRGFVVLQQAQTLVASGAYAQALRLIEEQFGGLQEVSDDEHDHATHLERLLPTIALARAGLGQLDEAAAMLEAGIARAMHDDRPLVFLGKLHEARARVALRARDVEAFERHAARVGELYRSVNNSVALLQHLALIDEAKRSGLLAPSTKVSPSEPVLSMATVQERRAGAVHEVALAGSPQERQARALALLLQGTAAVGGVLWASSGERFDVVACSDGETVTEALRQAVAALVPGTQRSEHDATNATRTEAWTSATGLRYQLVRLTTAGVHRSVLVGVAALRFSDAALVRAPSAALQSAIARALQEVSELGSGRSLEEWLTV